MDAVSYCSEFTPRWTLRSILLASGFTAAIYLMLPYLEQLSAPPEPDLSVRVTDTIDLPPPPPPSTVVKRMETAERETSVPEPSLQPVRQQFLPEVPAMNLEIALDGIRGDFSTGFRVRAPLLTEQVRKLVYEIHELDDPPRPLARLKPAYPSQARLRRIEGFVVVEFVVDADGAVGQVVAKTSEPGDVFTKAAVRAIQRWRFAPGTRGGEAVAVRVRQKVNFNLN